MALEHWGVMGNGRKDWMEASMDLYIPQFESLFITCIARQDVEMNRLLLASIAAR